MHRAHLVQTMAVWDRGGGGQDDIKYHQYLTGNITAHFFSNSLYQTFRDQKVTIKEYSLMKTTLN